MSTDDCKLSIEDLQDYLDTVERQGSDQRETHVTSCPQCLQALVTLRQIRGLSSELLDREAEATQAPDEQWFAALMGNVARESRSGRAINVSSGDAKVQLTQTEGAVIGLIRRAGTQLEGVLIGKCALNGDVQVPGEAVSVDIELTARYNQNVFEQADALRGKVFAALSTHTELNVTAINVAVVDIVPPPALADKPRFGAGMFGKKKDTSS